MRSSLSGFLLATSIALSVGPMAGAALAQEGKVTLVIANSQWLDALRGEKLWAAVKQYEKVAPNVQLEQEAIPSKDYADRLITEMSAGPGAGSGHRAGRPVLPDRGCGLPHSA
jgi:multiple sugar transport system substrate-binding protein